MRFLYQVTLDTTWPEKALPRVPVPYKLPVVLSPAEVDLFFEHVGTLRYRAALMTAYGAGLRVSEVVRLKVSDIDSGRGLLRVEQVREGSLRNVVGAPGESDAGLVAR